VNYHRILDLYIFSSASFFSFLSLQNRSSMMTILTSILHATNFQSPFLRTLVPSISFAYGIQAAVAIPSIFAQSERFYDLSGSLTYLSCTALSLYLPTLRARASAAAIGAAKPAWPSLLAALTGKGVGVGLNWRQVALSVAVSIWATRCWMSTSFVFIVPQLTMTNSGDLPLPTHLSRRS